MSLGHAQSTSRRGTLINFARTFVLFWALACQARAEDAPQSGAELDLSWQAASGCPDAAWAQEALRDRLGREVLTGPDARLEVQSELARVGSEFQLHLVTKQNGQLGERTLSGRQCQSLAQTAVLVIALAITDLEAAAPSPAEEPKPPAPSPPPTPPVPEEPAPAAPAPAPPAQDEANPFSLRAAAMLDAGFLPRLGFGPELTFGFTRRRLRVELAGFWLPSRESPPNDAGQVSVSLWALRPAACGRLLDASLSIDFCLGAELGRASGEGSGFDSDRKRHWFHRSAWAGLQVSLLLGPDWVLSLTPGISVPLGRPSFVSLATAEGASASEQTELHTSAAVSPRVALGIGYAF